MEEYLISETRPIPFGGRDAELHRLHTWLFDPTAPPRMLVTAPAGRGKSALLVQWMKILEAGGISRQDKWQFALMPISIRIGTNRPEIFYEGLARRLAEIAGEVLPKETIRDSEWFRFTVRDLVDRLAANESTRHHHCRWVRRATSGKVRRSDISPDVTAKLASLALGPMAGRRH
jgi:hypothetical protein